MLRGQVKSIGDNLLSVKANGKHVEVRGKDSDFPL